MNPLGDKLNEIVDEYISKGYYHRYILYSLSFLTNEEIDEMDNYVRDSDVPKKVIKFLDIKKVLEWDEYVFLFI